MLEEDNGLWGTVEDILLDLVKSVGPQRAEALYNAAIPQWFSSDLFTTLESEDAKVNLEWLAGFSFITSLSSSQSDFMMQPMERGIINEICIDQNPEFYLEAHSRALNYWLQYPHSDPFVQAQNVLYHRIIVDRDTARGELIDLFEHYADERQMGAMQQLLKAAAEACHYQDQLQRHSQNLEELISYMEVRQEQLQGNWKVSKDMLNNLDIVAESGLQPFVTRAYGYASAAMRNYADAIDYFQKAIKEFKNSEEILGEERSQIEHADTLIVLGDAYLGLAEATISLDQRRQRLEKRGGLLEGLYYLLLSLPLAAYMTRAIGLRALLPSLWAIWRDVDWVKADLYTQATSHYREADNLLSDVDRPNKDLIAEEKLADLYLSVGDAIEARTLYERLLASTELSEYRRSRILVGYGQTQWLLREEESAEEILTDALPAVRYYADEELEAEAETVLGSIAAHSTNPSMALQHYRRALDIYLIGDKPDLIAATDVAEQLDVMAEHPALPPDAKAEIRTEAARVAERRYPVQQRYGVTKFFQQLFLFAVIVLVGIGLLNTIPIERTTVAPEITFLASPLLDKGEGKLVLRLGTTSYNVSDVLDIGDIAGANANLNVGQGISSLVISDPELRSVIAGLGLSLLGYLVAVTIIGALLLWLIDPHDVQNTRKSATVRLTDEEISVGEGVSEQPYPFDKVSRYVIHNTRIFRQPIAESYLLLETNTGDQVLVNGSTVHYERVQKHIEGRLPETAERADLSHSLLISMAGVLLLFTVLLYLVLLIISRIQELTTHTHTLNAPISGSYYSGVSLLPYLLFGLILPVLWWFVWKPLQRRHRLDMFDWTPFLFILSGLLIALAVTITTGLGYDSPLSTPDLYPAFIAVSLVLAGVFALTIRAIQRRRKAEFKKTKEKLPEDVLPEDDALDQPSPTPVKRLETFAQRLPNHYRYALFIVLYILLILIAGLMFYYLSKEIRAYDSWVKGDHALREANRLRELEDDAWTERMEVARDLYTDAITFAQEDRLGVFRKELPEVYAARAHTSLLLGFEDPDLTFGPEGLSSYEAVSTDYSKAIESKPDNPQIYLWRGFAHHTMGSDDDKARALDNYACALLLSGIPMGSITPVPEIAWCPEPEGTMAFSGEENILKALTGRGWIYFADEKFEEALSNFLLASKLADLETFEGVSDTAKNEIALGLGYTYYKLKKYDKALQVWQDAEERDPQNAALLSSLGTVSWRLATLGDDFSASGTNRCKLDSPEERERAEALLQQSVDYLTRSAEIGDQPDSDRAFYYRTRGQIYYLLQHCPGYVRTEALQDAVDSYSEAIALDSENSLYNFYRGRLRYALWSITETTEPDAREPVVLALTDMDNTFRLDGRHVEECPDTDYEPCGWYRTIEREAVDRTLDRGYERINQGDYQAAIGYFSLLTEHLPNLPELYLAQLGLGLAELVSGNTAEAVGWYESGISNAALADDKTAIVHAWNQLLGFREQVPTADFAAVQAIFDRLDFAYDVIDSFSRGKVALDAGETVEAQAAFDQGLSGAVAINDLKIIMENLLSVMEAPPGETRDEILALFRDWLPRIEQIAAGDNAVEEAFDVGFVAWVLENPEVAAQWYQEGIRRTAEFYVNNSDGDSIYRAGLRSSRDDLFDYWQAGADVDADELIAFMDAYRPTQLQEYPELEEHPWYWRYQGWFKYHIGLKAFLAGETDIAASVLESGRRDAEVAFPLDEDGNRAVKEYLEQGAWSWYLIERAMIAESEENYDTALADYVDALEAYPDTITETRWAQDEAVDAAFKAGLLAYRLGDREQALKWYEAGAEYARSFGKEDKLIGARESLQVEESVDDEAADLKEEILALLDSG